MNRRRQCKRITIISDSDSDTCDGKISDLNCTSFIENGDTSVPLMVNVMNKIIFGSSASESSDFMGPLNQNTCRKRKRNPGKHKKAILKELRNSGKQYVNVKGHLVGKKTFSNTLCGCKNNCVDKITPDSRQAMFDSFWQMGDFCKQNTFIAGLIQRYEVVQRRPRKKGGILRSGSNKYFLKTENGLSVAVCRKLFLDTLCISEGRVNRVLKKVSIGKQPGEDLRGRKGCQSRKIPEDLVNYMFVSTLHHFHVIRVITQDNILKTENI